MQNQKTLITKEGYTTTMQEFKDLFKQLMATTWVHNNKEYNLTNLGWSMGFNDNKSSLGKCFTSRKRIEISKGLLIKNFDKASKFEDTIRHEIAHAIDTEIRGRSSHDYIWKLICLSVGAEPTRVNKIRLVKPQGKYTATCNGCGAISQAYRKPKITRSCGSCSKGSFNVKYVMYYKQNY